MQLAIVADDLSGAAECAFHALLRVSRSSVVLNGSPDPADRIVTIDTDTRGRPVEEASDRLRTAAALVRAAPMLVKKVDSLLRGNLSAEIASLAAELGRTPVVAVANPALARTVRGGVLHIGDTPLHATDLWHVEPTDPPPSVAHALAPLATVLIPQSVVARGVDAVTDALADALQVGAVAVCDSLTEQDLSTIHAATLALTRETLLVGSGALVDVAVRALAPGPELHGGSPSRRLASLLMLLGTRAPAASAQLGRIASQADHVEVIAPTDLLADPEGVRSHLAEVVSNAHDARLVVMTIDPAAVVHGSVSSRLVAALADAVAPLADRFDGVFLSGGETARAVLDRLGTRTLHVVGQLGTGTVVSEREGGAVVVTRPGSFGSPDSLLHVAQVLLGSDSTAASAAPAGIPTHFGATTGASSTATSTAINTAITVQPHVTSKENP